MPTRAARPVPLRAVLLDVDGTLLDTNYLHVLAWSRAFRDHDLVVPMAEIHRRIGMGSDQLLQELVGEDREDVADGWKAHYGEIVHDGPPLEGAHDLLVELVRRGLRVALATSGAPEFVERTRDVLGLDALPVEIVTSGEVERSKPHPDLFALALEKLGVDAPSALAVGDTVWDVQASGRAGVACIGVTAGGTDERALLGAGAIAVATGPADLLARWDSLLRASDEA